LYIAVEVLYCCTNLRCPLAQLLGVAVSRVIFSTFFFFG
jgi:hypothetical protein